MFDFDSFSNVIFIFIAVAIFIGRTIVQIRGGKRPEQKPRIPVHFEDEERDAGEKKIPARVRPERDDGEFHPRVFSPSLTDYIQELAARAPVAPRTAPEAPKSGTYPEAAFFSGGGNAALAKPASPGAGTGERPSGLGRGFPGNLGRLPPLKQAVALAEILGTPKGL